MGKQYRSEGVSNMTKPMIPKTPFCVEEARNILFEQLVLMPSEKATILESCGRILAQDVSSDIDISPFDNSAMDGFAVRFEDFEAARPTEDMPLTLPIVGIIAAGEVFEQGLQAGETLRIMTGAPLPQGADTVVRLEDVCVLGVSTENPAGNEVVFTKMPKHQANVRIRGEEARKGEVLLCVGERVSPPGAGLLASTGNAEVLVFGRPRVAIISTGSELVSINDKPGRGQIRNSNSYSLGAAVLEAGGIPTILPSVADDPKVLSNALLNAVAMYDFVITSGGAADGDFDFIASVVGELGEVLFSKVNMKPGKAQIFGLINGTPVFGLPGNPGAASVGFEIFIRPALRKMQGVQNLYRPTVTAVLKQDVKKHAESRRLYLRARLSQSDNGVYHVSVDPNQSSALLGALNRSNCLAVMYEGQRTFSAGDMVDCLRIDTEDGAL